MYASARTAQDEYVAALLRDLEHDLPRVWGRTVHSVFLGGGTPSLFDPEPIDRLLSGIRARLPLVVDWLKQHRPDVLCLQEIKCRDEDFPADPFREEGYTAAVRGQKAVFPRNKERSFSTSEGE